MSLIGTIIEFTYIGGTPINKLRVLCLCVCFFGFGWFVAKHNRRRLHLTSF